MDGGATVAIVRERPGCGGSMLETAKETGMRNSTVTVRR